MATTFLQAMKERYEALAGLPEMGEEAWAGIIPEGKANNFPNVLCQHAGEVPTYRKPGAGDDPVAYETGKAGFEVYATSLAQCEALAGILKAGFGVKSLSIDGKDTLLFRTNYLVRWSGMRGPTGHYVYRADVEYEAKFDNTG